MTPKTHSELEALKLKKMETFYKVKKSFETVTKDVDMTKRIVQSVPNTYNFFDCDYDVLVPGCAIKTIAESGPQSNGDAKIKNVKDHNISQRIGLPLLIDERKIADKSIMYAESKMLTTTLGNDMLIEYQEGVIDNHSIGFQYLDIELIDEEATNWSKYIGQLINPDDATKAGFMFLVKEIKLYEWSPVSFGANELTPYLGVKAGNKDGILLKLIDRMNLLEKQLRSGKQSDYAMLDYELEFRQLKQIVTEVFSQGPSIKDTLIAERRSKEDTHAKDTGMVVCPSCMHAFNYDAQPEVQMGAVKCPDCGQFVSQDGAMVVPFDLSKALQETTFFKN